MTETCMCKMGVSGQNSVHRRPPGYDVRHTNTSVTNHIGRPNAFPDGRRQHSTRRTRTGESSKSFLTERKELKTAWQRCWTRNRRRRRILLLAWILVRLACWVSGCSPWRGEWILDLGKAQRWGRIFAWVRGSVEGLVRSYSRSGAEL